jgi:hypothetical protein
VLENKGLRGGMTSKKEEGTGGWKKLLNEELHNL